MENYISVSLDTNVVMSANDMHIPPLNTFHCVLRSHNWLQSMKIGEPNTQDRV